MATLYSILTNGTTTNFGKLNVDSGPRYYIDDTLEEPKYDNGKFHAPGWNGNAIIRRGYTGQKIILNVRYQGILADIHAAWKTDRDLFAQYNNQLTDGVTVWARATLESAARTSEELAYGAGTTKFFTVRYVFTAEEQY